MAAHFGSMTKLSEPRTFAFVSSAYFLVFGINCSDFRRKCGISMRNICAEYLYVVFYSVNF